DLTLRDPLGDDNCLGEEVVGELHVQQQVEADGTPGRRSTSCSVAWNRPLMMRRLSAPITSDTIGTTPRGAALLWRIWRLAPASGLITRLIGGGLPLLDLIID